MQKSLERLDASSLEAKDIEALERVLDDRPALVGREGFQLRLPDPIFHLLLHVVALMKKHRSILLMPEDETFTTQAAAQYLGVSRPFLVKLIESGEIRCHFVGSHRRIALSDLVEYSSKRAQRRREVLDRLTEEVSKSGKYDEGAAE